MEKISDSLGTGVALNPALCLLNSLKGNERIGGKKAQWLKVALTTAKRVILRHLDRGKQPYLLSMVHNPVRNCLL